MKRDDVPCVPLSFNELSAIDSVLHGYLAFLRGVVPPSEERNSSCGPSMACGVGWLLSSHLDVERV